MKISVIDLNRQPKLYVCRKAMNKMKEYIDQVDKEVGWLGTVVKQNNNYIVEDVYLFKQEVHSTTTEITVEGLNEFAMELLQTEEGFEVWNKMKMWGHSHVNMTTSPSGQDNSQMSVFKDNCEDFFIRLIANKKGDFRFDIYNYENGVAYEEMNYMILEDTDKVNRINAIRKQMNDLTNELNALQGISDEDKQAIKSEIEEKVKTKTYVTQNYGGYGGYKGINNYDNYNDYYDWWDNQYGNSKKNEVKKINATNVIKKDANSIFSSLSEEDVFLCMYSIENGESIVDLLPYEISFNDELALEELIEIYSNQNYERYAQWVTNNI